VSEVSRRLEVAPFAAVVVSVEPVEVEKDLPFLDDSPERRAPFIYGKDGEEEAADVGERSSGVDDRVLVSPFVSGGWANDTERGVDICDRIGVVGLLYTGAIWKVLSVANGATTFWRRNVS
jgi:hypothetical protein